MKGVKNMVEQIFSVLGQIATGFAGLVVDLFNAVVAIFWTAPAEGATGAAANGTLTIVGTLALIAVGTGLVIWAFNFIRRLIRIRTKA